MTVDPNDKNNMDKSNLNILQRDFSKMNIKVHEWKLGHHNEPPNLVYIIVSGKPQPQYISYAKWEDMNKRWNAWYDKYKEYPNYVTINTENIIISDDAPDGNGCRWSPRYLKDRLMKQDTNTWCGLNAIQQVFYELFGIIITEQHLFNYGYTGGSGTGPNEMKTIISKLAKEKGVSVRITTYSKKDISWTDIGKAVAKSNIGVFFHEYYMDRWGHWDYCVIVCPINIYMANSLQGAVVGYSRATMERWFSKIMSDDSIWFVERL